MATTKTPVCITLFEPRRFPEVIIIDEHTVTGPFCKNCGFPVTVHIDVKNRRTKQMVLGCPPPNGMNPIDPRCHACTLKAMHLTIGQAKHRRDCPEWSHPLWP